MVEWQRFVVEVEKMRELQRKYFRLRDKQTLIESKEQEKLIDNWIKEIQQKEPTLWNIT